ncbi:MAG: serine/threonine protein phosphatase [Deltaproteobacteria bacterium]|nr:serine/threonine protein phosphatase [Deltaproteobacteria bacterium]MBW2073331.1 serine/threonine protein phosphatase [Deltaproteobacteria bacterium]RLB83190.1 MAG: serine/threonine protein phosphatase [Deltaproteobacteria bacterium]
MDVTKKIFAVGDIHGCFDKLVSLMQMLEIDWDKDVLVFIGDYIDRGPHSKEVVEYLIDLSRRQSRVIFLKGNHELMLQHYLSGINRFRFLANGGQATLDSYLKDSGPAGASLIPTTHLDFFDSLRLYYETDQYIFVHAGLKANIPLEEQDEWDMLWIRDEFIYSDFDFGKCVIFGHTPFHEPHVLDNKIGIDTGAVYGNKLTCVELPAVKFFSV